MRLPGIIRHLAGTTRTPLPARPSRYNPAAVPPLGLIAGEGVFPLLVARGARATGREVVCAAFAGHAWPDLRKECDRFSWVGVCRFGQWVKVLKAAGCTEAIMVGRVAKN